MTRFKTWMRDMGARWKASARRFGEKARRWAPRSRGGSAA